MSGGGFSRPVRLDEIGDGIARGIEASEIERAALVKRFDFISLSELAADFDISGETGGTRVSGTIRGKVTVACSISAEPVEQVVNERIAVLVVPDIARTPDEEIELDLSELDIVLMNGGRIDLGEIAAESFALALDPYPLADDDALASARTLLLSEEEAEAARQKTKQAASPFAALKPGGSD